MKVSQGTWVRLGQAGLPLALLAGWQVGSRWAGEAFLPSPGETLRTFRHGVATGWLWENLAVTLRELGWGFAWAAALGLALGVALGLSRLLREAFEAPLLALYAIPKVTLFPIFLFLFKLGPESKIAFGAFHGLFPVAIFTWGAMRAIRPAHLKVARSLRLAPAQLLWEIVVPSILPSLMTGLRLGFNLTFLGVILGEMFGSRHGLGFLLMSFGAAFDMSRVLVVIVIVALVAVGANAALHAAELRLGRPGGLAPAAGLAATT